MLTILIILTILILDLLVIFTIQSRLTRIILVLIANLSIILLYCITIGNSAILQKLIIATIVYSGAISYLIINNKENSSHLNDKAKIIAITVLTTAFATLAFYSIKNIQENLQVKREILLNSQITKLELPGVPNAPIPENESKFQSLQNLKFKNNILISRFSDFLIIISAIISLLFLNSANKIRINRSKE